MKKGHTRLKLQTENFSHSLSHTSTTHIKKTNQPTNQKPVFSVIS